MSEISITSNFQSDLKDRASLLLAEQKNTLHRRIDRLFAGLLILQWLTGIAIAFWISPLTWIGTEQSVHIHVWASIILGGVIIAYPVFMVWKKPGSTLTRHSVGVSQMMWSALLIHLTGGRIESHFHVFGSLAFLSFYRDWRVLISASIVVALDHWIRGVWFPQSVFGAQNVGAYRWLEHAGWVVFEDIFLIGSCVYGMREMRQIAERQADLENTNTLIEETVKQRTSELAESEERNRTILTSVIDGIITIDEQGIIESLNPATENIFGFRADEMIGNNVSMLMPQPHRDAHDGYLNNFLLTGEAKVIGIGREVKGMRKDGSLFPMDLAVSPLSQDGERKFVGVVRDITDRKALEDERAKDELEARFLHRATAMASDTELFEDALQECIDLVCEMTGWPVGHAYVISNADTSQLRPTSIWCRKQDEFETFRTATEETLITRGVGLPGRILASSKPEWIEDVQEDRNFARAQAAQEDCVRGAFGLPIVIDDKVVAVLEFFSRDQQPHDHWLLRVLATVSNEIGRVLDRKRVTDRLAAAKAEAEKVSQAKSEFLASMSHELRTPLNAIIGFTEGLLSRVDKHPLNDHQQNRLNRVKVAGQHLLALINDILDIAKVEAGQMPVNRTTFEIAPLIEEVGSLAEPLIREKSQGVEFSIEVDGDLPALNADRDKVKQILMNLLSNAIKFTEAGSVRFVVQEDNGYLQFSIEDSGIGIKESEIHQIFKKFYQAGAVHQQGGTGLGLSLCKQFAEILGGVLGVRSVEGRGSTFTLSLPLVESLHTSEDATELVERIKQKAAEGPRESNISRVMCVEDNPDNMLLLQDCLTESGCHVIPVLESREAIAIATREQPDLIVLDVMMPGLDGWELLRRFKADADTKHIPIILATAIDNRDLGFSLGADDYLTKPIQKPQLIDSILRQIGSTQKGSTDIAVVDDDPAVRDVLSDLLQEQGFNVRCFEDGAPFLEALREWEPDGLLLDLMMPNVDGFAVVEAMQAQPQWAHIPTIILTAAILSSQQLVQLNRRVQLIVEKNGMSRENTLARVVEYLESVKMKGKAA